jgi:hypothetical protein
MLKKFKQKIDAVPSFVKSSLVGTSLLAVAGSASASAISTPIGDAFSSATTDLQSVGIGVVALAAIVTGIGLITSLIRR